MTGQETTLEILSIEEARGRGLVPLTMAETLDTPIQVGHSAESIRYIEWLTIEQQRITQSRDRQAAIVDEGQDKVALWVDDVASRNC